MVKNLTNKIVYLIFCALLGAVIAVVVWVFLRLILAAYLGSLVPLGKLGKTH